LRGAGESELLTYGSLVFSYTGRGDLETKTTASGATVYAYDSQGNLRRVALASGTAIEYLVDGENRCIGKLRNGALEEAFLYETAFRPSALLDSAGNVVIRFVYGSTNTTPDYIVRDPGTVLETTYRVVSDERGSPRLIVDVTSGVVAQELAYDEFGRVTIDTNPGFQPFGFAGGLYDPDTGLLRFGRRDYDPITGRWTSKDPLLFSARDTNVYAYASDAVNAIDPTGLFTFSLGVKVSLGGGIGGGGGTFLNFGYSAAAGFSISVTGTAEAGAVAGVRASVQGVFQYTGLDSVYDLNGTFYSAGPGGGAGIIGGADAIYDASMKPVASTSTAESDRKPTRRR